MALIFLDMVRWITWILASQFMAETQWQLGCFPCAWSPLPLNCVGSDVQDALFIKTLKKIMNKMTRRPFSCPTPTL